MVVSSFALLCATATVAAQSRPLERACLISWNAPANRANHVRLLAERPVTGLLLGAGIVSTDTWSKGSKKQTSSQACLLTIMKRGQIRTVTGVWQAGGVTKWTFGRAIPTNEPPHGNVRLLADGRVTKV